MFHDTYFFSFKIQNTTCFRNTLMIVELSKIFLGHHREWRPHNSLINLDVFILLFYFCLFLHLFFTYWTEQTTEHIIIDYCASPSNSLISLSYSMVAFCANLFGLFVTGFHVFFAKHWTWFDSTLVHVYVWTTYTYSTILMYYNNYTEIIFRKVEQSKTILGLRVWKPQIQAKINIKPRLKKSK